LRTLSVHSFIEDAPSSIFILDERLCFISHSKPWLKEFQISDKNIIGKSYYDVLPETPLALKKVHQECLQGKTSTNEGTKFTQANGKVQWLKWRINPWKTEDGKVGGLVIAQEDITLQKRREEIFLKAQKVAKIGGWELDLITNDIFWTDTTKEIHEVPSDFQANLENAITFYKAGEHRNRITELVNEALAKGTPWDTELIIITARGKERWVHAKGETEMHHGKCVRIFGTFQDIDEKKKAEVKYQAVAERLKIATKAAQIGIWELNLNKGKLIWDDIMLDLHGVSKKHFSANSDSWARTVHPDDLEQAEMQVNEAIKGQKELKTEYRVIWPDGTTRNLIGMGKTIKDFNGTPIKMVGANWDITELKTTQLQLIRSRESFLGAFENSTLGMAIISLDGKWTQVNDSICKILGYENHELLKLTFQDVTHPEDLQSDLDLLHELVSGKRDSYQIDKRYFHKKGHIVYVVLTVTGVKDINGKLSYFISQIMDITARIEDEHKLTQLVKVTEKQNTSLLNFAHIVSHNLRSHSSNLSMLTGFLKRETNENERGNLTTMLDAASESLDETVMHLNEVVQVKSGALNKLKNVNLYKTIINVEKNLSGLLQDKKATCIIDVPKHITVKGIPAYLDSIFLNLFTNSIKYSAVDRPPKLTIKVIQKDDYRVIVTFADNGLGINLKRHGKKLFGMYKTFHRNKDAKGIGLFITKNQIEAMNGSITVDSTVNVGTEFTLIFDK
tara:strand:- start:283405 stop:285600 length:2196 start_codon:yes stop_codon:yes gene_type:complete